MSSLPLDFFLNNEELSKIHELAIPSNEMYRFFPPSDEILLQDSNPQKNIRFIFNGQPKTEFEQRKLSEYNDYELKHGKLTYPDFWLESETMRLLQAAEYDVEKAYKSIIDTINFINKNPIVINDRIISALNSGIMYVYGRDHHFRPLIQVSVKTYIKIIDKKEFTFDEINKSIIYLINYIFKYLFIPGQIENWVTIIDFKGAGVSDISDFKKLLGVLNSYRGRVFRNYFINVSGFLGIAVKAAVNLFGSSTARKLKILAKDELHLMNEIISPDNIQKKFGGTAPDALPGNNNLFPPRMPSKNFAINGEKLNIISEEAYKEMCLNGNPFKPFTISPKYQEKWEQEKKAKEQEVLNMINKTSQIQTKEIESTKPSVGKSTAYSKEYENIRMKEINKRMSEKQNVINFLKEFEEFDMVQIIEDKKYYSKQVINIEKINSFFQKIPKSRKTYFY